MSISLLSGGAAKAQSPAEARVSGIVFDSLAVRPLAGALVQLVPAAEPARVRSVRTDARGRFAFDSVAPGSYVAGVLHPLVDSLLILPPERVVTVRPGAAADASLFIPSARALRKAFCGDASGDDDGAAVFIGRLRSAHVGRLPMAGRVRAEWPETMIGGRGDLAHLEHVEATAADDGAFALCGLPAGIAVNVSAWSGADSTGALELPLPQNGLLKRDLFIGALRQATSGVLRGMVRLAGGAPIAGATVAIRGAGVQVVTSDSGAFTLGGVPVGTHTLVAQAIRYDPYRASVDIDDTVSASIASADVASVRTVDVVLVPLGQMVDTFRVNASRVPLRDRWIAGFEERRKLGFGHFIDEETIARLNPLRATDALRLVAGVRVAPGIRGNQIVFPRHQGIGGPCIPNVFLDGVLLQGANVDEVVASQEVRAIEVYTSAANRPAQFTTPNGCGTIVIWRGMRKINP